MRVLNGINFISRKILNNDYESIMILFTKYRQYYDKEIVQ
jgi:hypothetical protein